MAEEVVITGLGTSIPVWATEATQNKILKALDKIGDINNETKKSLASAMKKGSGSGKVDDKEFKKISESIKKQNASAQTNTQTTKDNTKAKKQNSKTVKEVTDAMGKLAKTALGSLATAAGAVTGMFMNQMDSFDALYKSGIDLSTGLSGGLASLSELSNRAGLAFENLVGVMKEYGQAVHKYGTKQFATTVGGLSQDLLKFGYTTKETSEFLGGYLENQRVVGLQQRLSQQQLADSAMKSAENTVKWSTALGKSREEIEKQMKEGAGLAEVQNFIRSISDPELAKRVQESVDNMSKSISDPTIRDTMLRMISTENPMADPQVQELLRGGATEIVAQMMNYRDAVRNGTLSQKESEKMILSLASAAKTVDRQLVGVMGPAGKATMEAINALELNAEQLKMNSPMEQKASETRADFYNTLEKLRSVFEQIVGEAFGTGNVLGSFTTLLKDVVGWISANKGDIVKAISGILEGLIKLGGWIHDFIKSPVNIKDLVNDTISSIGDVFAEKMKEFAVVAGLAVIGLKGLSVAIKSLVSKFTGGSGVAGGLEPNKTKGSAGKGSKLKSAGKLAAKVAGPLAIVVAGYDAIQGAIDDATTTADQGGDKIATSMSALRGTATGLFDTLIGGVVSIADMVTDKDLDSEYSLWKSALGEGFQNIGSSIGGKAADIADYIKGTNDIINSPAPEVYTGKIDRTSAPSDFKVANSQVRQSTAKPEPVDASQKVSEENTKSLPVAANTEINSTNELQLQIQRQMLSEQIRANDIAEANLIQTQKLVRNNGNDAFK